MNISPGVRTALLAIITAVWVVNFAAGFVVADYNPSESVNAVFMLVIGAIFALSKREEKGGDGDG